ncbi:MAG: hypothetical protein L3J25_10300 [Flavobacteriaceae bacterium]|nr:hypothetical protein [Flavobacteriaceae bacterium]
MFDQVKIIIKDSCIIIDLIELELIDFFLKLEYHILTTENVVEEITEINQKEKLGKLISVNSIMVDGDFDLNKVFDIMNNNGNLSFTDATVLELALRSEGILLTSDNALRRESKKLQRKTHGILWVIEALYENGIISAIIARDKVNLLMEINQRIPKQICKQLLIKLEKKQKTYNYNK